MRDNSKNWCSFLALPTPSFPRILDLPSACDSRAPSFRLFHLVSFSVGSSSSSPPLLIFFFPSPRNLLHASSSPKIQTDFDTDEFFNVLGISMGIVPFFPRYIFFHCVVSVHLLISRIVWLISCRSNVRESRKSFSYTFFNELYLLLARTGASDADVEKPFPLNRFSLSPLIFYIIVIPTIGARLLIKPKVNTSGNLAHLNLSLCPLRA